MSDSVARRGHQLRRCPSSQMMLAEAAATDPQMAELFLSLLGSFEARTPPGHALTFPTRKTKALLAYLALHQNTLVEREALRRLLWSDRDVEHGRSSLRQALKALHVSVGHLAALKTDRRNVGFIDGPIDLDVVH